MKMLKKSLSVLLCVLLVLTVCPISALTTQYINDTGSYTEGGYNGVTWHYDAETDTMYIDGEIIAPLSDDARHSNYLPLYIYAEEEFEYDEFDDSYLDDESIDWDNLTDEELAALEEAHTTHHTRTEERLIGYCGIDFAHLVFGEHVKELAYGLRMSSHNSHLQDVTFAENSQLEVIGTFVFSNATCRVDLSNTALKRIGRQSFQNYKGTSVILPDTVEVIEQNAFYGASFTEIQLPSALKEVQESAFQNVNLTGLTIPDTDNEITIGAYAFNKVKADPYNLPANVVSIGQESFDFSNVTAVRFKTKTVNGKLMGMREIGYAAFENLTGITSVTLPETVETIGPSAFEGDASLVSLHLSDSIQLIDNAAFVDTGLTSVTIPDTDNEITIGAEAFSGVPFENISFPANVVSIGQDSFDMSAVEIYTFPTKEVNGKTMGLKEIGASTFKDCDSLRAITLPSTLETIGSSAFSNTDSLVQINLPDSVKTIGNYAFNAAYGVNFTTLPQSIETIGNNAFEGSGVREITLPDTEHQITIGDSAFASVKLINNSMPGNVVAIGKNNFNFTGKETFVFETKTVNGEQWGLKALPEYFFSNTGLIEITLPETLESIGTSCFANAQLLQEINLPSSLTAIGARAFSGCKSLKRIDLSHTNVTTLNQYAFYNCKELSAVVLNDDMTSIPNYCFQNCSALESIVIPDGVTSIGQYAFYCSGLKSVAMPKSLESVGGYAFYKTPLNSVVFTGNSEVTIGTYAFRLCNEMEILRLPKKLKRIYSYAFQNCSALESVLFPTALETIEKAAFADCQSLSAVRFEKGAKCTVIGQSAFAGDTELTEISLPEGVQVVSGGTFYNCSKLWKVQLPSTVSTIASDAFTGTALTSLTIPNASAKLERAFVDAGVALRGYADSTTQTYAETYGHTFVAITETGSESEEEVVYENGIWQHGTWTITTVDGYRVLTIGGSGVAEGDLIAEDGTIFTPSALVQEGYIEKIVFEEGITAISENYLCFETANSLPIVELVLPEGLIEIGNGAFYQLMIMDTVFPSTLTTIGDYAFYGNFLHKLILPDAITSLGKYAFANVNAAGGITLGNGITVIPEGCFYGCDANRISIPATVNTVEKKAFGNCPALIHVEFLNKDTAIYFDDSNPSDAALGFNESGEFVNQNLFIYAFAVSTAFDYANQTGILFGGDLNTCDESGYLIVEHSNVRAKWYYYKDSKTVYLTCKGSLLNGEVYINVGKNDSEPYDGSLEVETLYICSGVTEIYNDMLNIFNPKYVVLPNSLTCIGYRAFRGFSRLESLAIPDSVTRLESEAFVGCRSLKALKIGSGLTDLVASAFKGCSGLEYLSLSEGLWRIGDHCFQNCTNLQEINLPDTVEIIGKQAFYKCIQVVSIHLGSAIRQIGTQAFAGMPLCEKVTVTGDGFSSVSALDIFSGMGSSTGGTTAIFTDDVSKANLITFASTDFNLTTVQFGKAVNNIYNFAVLPRVNAYLVDSDNTAYFTENGAIYQGETLIRVPHKVEVLKIRKGTTAIGTSAFEYANITEIYVPDSVSSIGKAAFRNCAKLKSVRLPETITIINESTFENCTKLKTIDIPLTVKSVGAKAFRNCSSLASVIMHEGLQSIQTNAFNLCVSLEGIVLPESLKIIGSAAFAYCYSLSEVYIWYTEVNNKAFNDSENVRIYTMGGSSAYAVARSVGLDCTAYTDEDVFYDLCGEKYDVYLGFIGYCTDGHGAIEWLTVYEADCENDGYCIGVCEYCSEILEERHESATGHNYKLLTEVSATATMRGIRLYKCVNCAQTVSEYTSPTVENMESQIHQVTFNVVLATNANSTQGSAPAKGVSLMSEGVVIAVSDADGNIFLSLETGVYNFSLHYQYGFDRPIVIVVEDEDIAGDCIPIVGCDWNKDGIINEGDYTLFRYVISSEKDDVSYLEFVDINNDGYINAKDYLLIKTFNGYDNASYNYPPVVIQK